MKATANRIAQGMVLGAALLASAAGATAQTIVRDALSGLTTLGQYGTDADTDRRAEADRLLRQARQALKDGDIGRAEKIVAQADALHVQYDPLTARFEETPEKVRHDIQAIRNEQQASSDATSRGASDRSRGSMPADPFAAGRATQPSRLPSAAGEGSPYDSAAGQNDPRFAGRNYPDTSNSTTTRSRDEAAARNPYATEQPRDTRGGGGYRWATEETSAATSQRSPYAVSGQDDASASAEGGNLLLDARRAMARGDVQRAAQLARRAGEQGYVARTAEDSPQRVEALLRQYNKLAPGPRSDEDPQEFNREYARFLLEQVYGLMRHGDLQTAAWLASSAKSSRADFSGLDTNPDRLLAQITAQQRQSEGAAEPADEALSQVRALVAQARIALDRGKLETASSLARRAEEMRVPDDAFSAEEMRPWQLRLEIDRAANRGNFSVAQAGGADNRAQQDRFPVQRGVYDPQQDNTRVSRAAYGGADQQDVATPVPTPNAEVGKRLYRQGMEALDRGDANAARDLFGRAWAHASELDPIERQELQEKLSLLRSVDPRVAAQGGSPLEQVDAEQQLIRQKLMREIASEQSEADRMREYDPRGALERLVRLRDRVSGVQVDPAVQKQLLTMIDRQMNDLEQYIERNRADIDQNERNRGISQDVDDSRSQQIEVQNKIGQLVDKFNTYMEEERYAEAEIVARQARELAPNEPVVQTLMWKSRFVRRFMSQMSIQDRKEQGFIEAMESVDIASEPMNDMRPYQFGEPRTWDEMTRRRRRMLDNQRSRISPSEVQIQQALRKPVQVRFTDRPLSEVLNALEQLAGINIHLDPQGMAAEGVTSDTPVTINLTQPISVKSALNLILQPLRLGYVIQDEVLLVTTESARDSNVFVQVYNVADLVIPIPNFVPSYNMGLPGAIASAFGSQWYGPQGNFGAPVSPYLSLASNPARSGNTNPSILAMQGGGFGGSRSPQLPMGPGGLSDGMQPDFDPLVELVTSTVSPQTWAEVGGPGSIREFATNLSLVISTTQEVHQEVADLLEQLRRLQDLQVTVEVRFITLADNFFERIGVDFDFNIDDNVTVTPLEDEGPSVTIGLDPVASAATGVPVPTADLDLQFRQGGFNSAVPQFGGFDANSAANFGFAILSDIEVFFLLQAAHGDDRSNVMQAPKVTLFNGQNAFVSDQSQTPFVTSIIPVVGDFAAAQQPVIVVLSEGTSLSVQAVVSSDRRFVRLTLVPFFSRIGEVREFTFDGKTTTNSGSAVLDASGDNQISTDNVQTTTEGTTVQLPTFAFTSVSTTVSVPDGGTVLLGGIKRLSEGRNERGVPLLEKLPYINRLFKNVGIGRTTQSLMLMVTPRIIIQEEEEELATGVTAGS